MVDYDYLRRLPFWDHLSDSEKELVEANSMINKYSKGQMIYNSDVECSGIMMVLTGELRMSIMSEEGREITLYRLYENELCALTAACILEQITFDTQTTVTGDCAVLIVNTYTFEKLMNGNIHVRCFMYELLSERFSSVVWTMQMILFKKYDCRLASFLINEYEQTGDRIIKMTHDEIAQYTNSAREVVARMLKRFANDGLLEFKRGKIILLDIQALKEIV
ncbi:MAG: Crp/Fnr family transcriptional regulator [Anaerovoracaceae bacterium]